MRPFLLALAVSGIALPSFAMEAATMPCADFVKLDEAGQMAAMAPDGDAGGMMASSGDAGGMMASSGDAGGMMGGDGGEDHAAMMAASACAAHPDMSVGEAMKAN